VLQPVGRLGVTIKFVGKHRVKVVATIAPNLLIRRTATIACYLAANAGPTGGMASPSMAYALRHRGRAASRGFVRALLKEAPAV
jgi:hypothetical protein